MAILREIKFWIEIFFLVDGSALMLIGAAKSPTEVFLLLAGFLLLLIVLLVEMDIWSYFRR